MAGRSLSELQVETVAGEAPIAAEAFRPYWRRLLGRAEAWPGEELFAALFHRFVRRIVHEDAAGFAALGARPRLYLANHQVAIESVLFVWALSAVTGALVRSIAKEAHQTTWLGEWLRHTFHHPSISPPQINFYRNEYAAASLVDMRDDIEAALARDGSSLLVHSAATRVLSCRVPLSVLSGFFVDLALRLELPIVPVRFAGGLPVETMDDFRDFPIGFTGQDYYLGRAIGPDELARERREQRIRLLLDRINGLGPRSGEEVPNPPQPVFRRRIQDWIGEVGTSQFKAVALSALESYPRRSPMTERLLAALERGPLVVGETDDERWFGQWAQWLTDGRLAVRTLPAAG